jgi:hypothetical protein
MNGKELGFETNFLYKYLNGSRIKRGEKLGLSRSYGTTDIRLMLDSERFYTVEDEQGRPVGWANGYVITFEDPPTKRPNRWESKGKDETIQTGDFDQILSGDGEPIWPVQIVPLCELGKVVKFVTLDGEEWAVRGHNLTALLRKAGRQGRPNVSYRVCKSSTVTIAVDVDGEPLGAVAVMSKIYSDGDADRAGIIVDVPARYHPHPEPTERPQKAVEPTPEPEPVELPEKPTEKPTEEPTEKPTEEPEPVTVTVVPKTHRGRPILLDEPKPEPVTEEEPAFYVAAHGEWGITEKAKPVYV